MSPVRHHGTGPDPLENAALADGVLVVEAGLRSGARNTVKWARRLGRPALAVPGPVTAASSVGCHRMIREGEALLVTNAEEVLAEAGPLRLPTPTPLTPEESTIYEALPKSGSHQPTDLATRTGLPLPTIRATLPALELAGLIACDSSGWHRVEGDPR
ncbi:DNA-processing protein DprA [Nocardia sp. NPDC003482]